MNKLQTQINHFDRSGEYYPLVISYLASLHGFFELISRGVIDLINEKGLHNINLDEILINKAENKDILKKYR